MNAHLIQPIKINECSYISSKSQAAESGRLIEKGFYQNA